MSEDVDFGRLKEEEASMILRGLDLLRQDLLTRAGTVAMTKVSFRNPPQEGMPEARVNALMKEIDLVRALLDRLRKRAKKPDGAKISRPRRKR